MGKQPFTRQQPYQADQTSDPAPAPAVPPVAWPDDEARHTVIRTNQEAWQRHTGNAQGHRGKSARLDAEIGAMSRQFEELRQRISAAIEEKQREDHYAGQEQKTGDGYAAALDALGAPVPAGDVLVAGGVEDPDPTGRQPQVEACPGCGNPMRWTPDQGFVHDMPGGGWASAGELCKQRATQAVAS